MQPIPLRARNRYSLDTIGLILAREHELVATCRPCGRSAALDLAAIIARRGADWPRSRVAARCKVCGQPAPVSLRPIRPQPDQRQHGDRPIPFIFQARASDMVDGDRVHYACRVCGDRWALLPVDLVAHPLAGPSTGLRDTYMTRCGNCGETSAIAAEIEWTALPKKYGLLAIFAVDGVGPRGHIEFTNKGATKMTTAKQLADFGRHYDAAVIAVFKAWTKNGLGLDFEEREQHIKSAQDALANSYTDGITLADWKTEALKRLGTEG